ncbi:MAG: hypothetical protein V7642_4831, partial [Burkholderiales bacterium]
MLGGAVGVAVLTSILISLLRNALPDAGPLIGGEMLMDLFHSANAGGVNAQGTAEHDAAASAFRNLFLICASISVISPLLMTGLREQELRGRPQPVASAE